MSKNKNDEKFDDLKSEKVENGNFHILNAGRCCVLRYIIAKEKEVEVEERKELKDKPKAKIKEIKYVNIVKESEMYFKKIIPFNYFFCLFDPIRANDPFCCKGYGRVKMVVIGMQKNMKNILKSEDEENNEENEDEEDDDEDENENFVIPNSPYIKTFLNGYCICQTSPLNEDKFSYVYPNIKQAIWDERVEFQIHNPYSTLCIQLADFDSTKGILNSFDDVFGCVKLQTNLLIPNQIYDIILEFPYLRTEDYPANSDFDSAVRGDICQTSNSPFYMKNESKKNLNFNDERSKIKKIIEDCGIYNKSLNCEKIKDLLTLPLEEMQLNLHAKSSDAKEKTQSNVDFACHSDSGSLLPHEAFLVDDFSTFNISSANDRKPQKLLRPPPGNSDSLHIKQKKKGYIVRLLFQLQIDSFISELSACTLPSPKKEFLLNKINFLELWKDLIILKTFVYDMYVMSIIRSVIDIYKWNNFLLSFFMLFLWIFGCIYTNLIFPLFFLLISLSLYLLPSDRITIDGKNVNLYEKMKDKCDIDLENKNKIKIKNFYKVDNDNTMQSSLLKSLLSSAVSSEMQIFFAKLHYCIIQITQGFREFLLVLQKTKRKLSALFLVCGILSWAFPLTVTLVIKYAFLIFGMLVLTKEIYIFDVIYRLLIGILKFFYLKRNRIKKQHLLFSQT